MFMSICSHSAMPVAEPKPSLKLSYIIHCSCYFVIKLTMQFDAIGRFVTIYKLQAPFGLLYTIGAHRVKDTW